jgi:DNA-binding transcriptional ArsR family regulator
MRAQVKKPKAKPSVTSRFAYDGLNRIIHERARLSLLTSLATHSKGLSFGELKEFCALTDGNLNRHLQVLEEARLVTVTKRYDHNRPQTVCKITALGRRRYLEYLEVLEQVITDGSQGSVEPDASGRRSVSG